MDLHLEEKQPCKICNNDTFHFVLKRSCETCCNNGISGEDGYEYRTHMEPNEERTECSDDGTCALGDSFGEGCSFTVCSKCKKLHEHIPFGCD